MTVCSGSCRELNNIKTSVRFKGPSKEENRVKLKSKIVEGKKTLKKQQQDVHAGVHHSLYEHSMILWAHGSCGVFFNVRDDLAMLGWD